MGFSFPSPPAPLQTLNGQPHQLWTGRQIPIRIGYVDVSEIGGKNRKTSLDIFATAIPLHSGLHSKSMTKIVQARSMASAFATQTCLSRQHIECPPDFRTVQSVSSLRDEKIVRSLVALDVSIPTRLVRRRASFGLEMWERNQAGLAELCSMNR